ncbi:hypothetical protein RB196_35940 [Streptomyces sp. PmtA]|uniref:hypothetical protein n=1 Tax=Streptomyces sp. PmtA TaxID=3074275 RepID=UPI0030152D3D
MTDKPEMERVDCPDCLALPDADNTRISYVKSGGGISETWHTPNCPALAIMEINIEEGAKQVREQEAWGPGHLPSRARAAENGCRLDTYLSTRQLSLRRRPERAGSGTGGTPPASSFSIAGRRFWSGTPRRSSPTTAPPLRVEVRDA